MENLYLTTSRKTGIGQKADLIISIERSFLSKSLPISFLSYSPYEHYGTTFQTLFLYEWSLFCQLWSGASNDLDITHLTPNTTKLKDQKSVATEQWSNKWSTVFSILLIQYQSTIIFLLFMRLSTKKATLQGAFTWQ